MLARIIFCVVIAAAVLAVVLLATVSPLPHHHRSKDDPPKSQRTFTVYIHPATSSSPSVQQQRERGDLYAEEASALVFGHRMTAGPESASRTVGAASGFLLPAGDGASSVFDTVHLAFDAALGMSGSLCVEPSDRKGSRRGRGEEEEELNVVGGTGAFAFARGHAVVRPVHRPGLGAAVLRLELSVSPAGS